jgi:hypothetical protein
MEFLIASSGRCGTLAICNGLSNFSDYSVMHEPEPRLLEEAYLKHQNLDYRTDTFNNKIKYLQDRQSGNYGESFRAPNLLEEINFYVPSIKFLVIIRDPLEYILSSHYKRVFQKDDTWDRMRLIPLDKSLDFISLSLSEKLCWHWATINHYLLDFVESKKGKVKLLILGDLNKQIKQIADYLEINILAPKPLDEFLSLKPNSSNNKEFPSGYDQSILQKIYANEWERAKSLAS